MSFPQHELLDFQVDFVVVTTVQDSRDAEELDDFSRPETIEVFHD